MNINQNNFEQVIRCSYHYCGGVTIEGIKIDYNGPHDKFQTAFIALFMWKRLSMEPKFTFWQRLKMAWRLLRGQEITPADIILNKEGTQQLYNACRLALEHWPTREQLETPRPSLAELYQKLQAEE